MSTIGDVPYFSSAYSSWPSFIGRLETFFELNDLTQDERRKKAILLTQVDDDCYDLLRLICSPISPKAKSFDELCQLIQIYSAKKKPIALYAKRAFYTAAQTDGETVLIFLERIQRLSLPCDFKEGIESILADRFISGLRSVDVIEKICEMEPDEVTLDVVVKIAMEAEARAKAKAEAKTETKAGSRKKA